MKATFASGGLFGFSDEFRSLPLHTLVEHLASDFLSPGDLRTNAIDERLQVVVCIVHGLALESRRVFSLESQIRSDGLLRQVRILAKAVPAERVEIGSSSSASSDFATTAFCQSSRSLRLRASSKFARTSSAMARSRPPANMAACAPPTEAATIIPERSRFTKLGPVPESPVPDNSEEATRVRPNVLNARGSRCALPRPNQRGLSARSVIPISARWKLGRSLIAGPQKTY
jgi:hypothetical protein